MIDQGKKNILGIQVDAVDYEAAVSRVIAATEAQEHFAATALAVHGLMTGVLDPVQKYRLNRLNLVTPDGQPVRWALNWLYGTQLCDRVYGPNFMLAICQQAQDRSIPIYLYGSSEQVITSLHANLISIFPRLIISGHEPSKFRQVSEDEQKHIVKNIISSGARLVFVGLGCPKQEVWIYENRNLFPFPLIAVGAAFDFHAGTLPQAPPGLQKMGLEWLFRLRQEPLRLWKRYVLLNPLYLWFSFLQKTGLKEFDPDQVQEPAEAMRYG